MEDQSDQTHTGTLQFWSSTATIFHIFERTRSLGPARRTFLSSDGEMLYVTGKGPGPGITLEHDKVPTFLKSRSFQNKQGDPLEGELLFDTMNLVIVNGDALEAGQSGPSGVMGSGRMLDALVVAWNNEVATVVHDPLCIAEEDWISIKKREWRLVTLN